MGSRVYTEDWDRLCEKLTINHACADVAKEAIWLNHIFSSLYTKWNFKTGSDCMIIWLPFWRVNVKEKKVAKLSGN